MKKRIIYTLLLFIMIQTSPLSGQKNYLNLPNPLTNNVGAKVTTSSDWQKYRRAEILDHFQTEMYGKVPESQVSVAFKVDDQNEHALGGLCRAKSVTATFSNRGRRHTMNIMIYFPKASNAPVPLFLGLNFYGNHTIHMDPNIPISKSWVPNITPLCLFENKADHLSRGVNANRWPVERIIERGYGLAVIYCGDLDPDYDDNFQNGIHRLFNRQRPADEEWGTISTWAWGLSRAMDYLEKDAEIDEKRIAVIGHSRLGKAALWAGAQDERFALVISNNSGCGGAALSRRRTGETVRAINKSFPHWFCKNFHQYNDKEDALPVDQHQLIALIAPRPVYVASAEQDTWADPLGEYLSLYHAAPVYRLLGHKIDLPLDYQKLNKPLISGPLGYHIRAGEHEITRYDWERYMDFADLQFGKN